jgi:pimeloyl-ACP methyl ester carboxylesterase
MEITVKDLKINYITEGSGADVLLLHGWGSSSDVYKGIIASLSSVCRFTALDFPGCGKSETMSEAWDIKDYADFVLEFIEKVGLENPILIGHSHGGRVCMYLAGNGLLEPSKIVLLDAAGLIPKKSAKQKLRAKSLRRLWGNTLPGSTWAAAQSRFICAHILLRSKGFPPRVTKTLPLPIPRSLAKFNNRFFSAPGTSTVRVLFLHRTTTSPRFRFSTVK